MKIPIEPKLLNILRALASSRRPVCFVGASDSGFSQLAQELWRLLPPLDYTARTELRVVYGRGLQMSEAEMKLRLQHPPVRAPHFAASESVLLGTGPIDQGGSLPGEASLAHYGVLFLENLPDFRPAAIRALLEYVQHPKHVAAMAWPAAKTWLVGSALPCPCGYERTPRCTCSPERVLDYRQRWSNSFIPLPTTKDDAERATRILRSMRGVPNV